MKSTSPKTTNKRFQSDTRLNNALQALYKNPMPSTRTGPIYNAFSYPTKISPEAIAIFIATHTKPGATVLDTFGGSGTAGLAALLCDKPTHAMGQIAHELGVKPRWGPRKAILYELGVIGSFLSKTMCNPPDPNEFKKVAEELLSLAKNKIGWVYEVADPQGNNGTFRHAIWSDVLLCRKCGSEITYWDATVRRNPLHFVEKFKCPSCKKSVLISDCERQTERGQDKMLGHVTGNGLRGRYRNRWRCLLKS